MNKFSTLLFAWFLSLSNPVQAKLNDTTEVIRSEVTHVVSKPEAKNQFILSDIQQKIGELKLRILLRDLHDPKYVDKVNADFRFFEQEVKRVCTWEHESIEEKLILHLLKYYEELLEKGGKLDKRNFHLELSWDLEHDEEEIPVLSGSLELRWSILPDDLWTDKK